MLALLAGCIGTGGFLDLDDDGFPSIASGGTDCDDADPAVHPGAVERWYDGVDQDCSGGSDYDADGDGVDADLVSGADCDDRDPTVTTRPTTVYADCDGDGVTSGVPVVLPCGEPTADVLAVLRPCGTARAPAGGFRSAASDPADCDDADVDVLPGPQAERWYDGADRNCDGRNDWDADGDGFVRVGADGRAGGTAPGVGDCDDTRADVFPGAPDTAADGLDADCDGTRELDLDADGFVAGPASGGLPGGDCDDGDPTVAPDRVERACDGLDNDCDPATDDRPDPDGDGLACELDCAPDDPAVFVGAAELCNGVDDDCDGEVDEGLRVDQYWDPDGDGYGAGPVVFFGCPVPGLAAADGDCAEGRADVHPGAPELCNGVDDDCSGAVDDVLVVVFEDLDGDGLGGAAVEVCDPTGFATAGGDCDDSDPTVGLGAAWYADCDHDGYLGAEPFLACDRPAADALVTSICGLTGVSATPPTAVLLDCDDGSSAVRPFRSDVCNGVDDDCDGRVDEGHTAWLDADGDGLGAGDPVAGCPDGVTFVDNALDGCDDLPTRWAAAVRGEPGDELQVLLDQVCPDGVVTLADAVWPVGGGLHVDVPLSLVGEGTATLDLLGDGRVDAHAPARLEGLVVTNGRATGLGGCVRGADGLELVDVVVSGCAVDPEPVLADAAAEACWTGACGGCVFASGAVTASGVVLEDCAAAAGGGLWVGGSGVLTDVVVDGTRTEASRVHAGFGTAGTDGGCALGRCGGGVYARGPLVLADVRIEGSVGTDGAGLYTTSDVDAVGLEVVGTTSSAGAGAIAHDGASFACTGCSLRDNHTDDGFRPSALESDGVVMLVDTEVIGNHPDVVPAVYACQPGQVGCTARWTLVDTVFDREPCRSRRRVGRVSRSMGSRPRWSAGARSAWCSAGRSRWWATTCRAARWRCCSRTVPSRCGTLGSTRVASR
ncbi:MAG: hypothetical protein H6734_08875 [Alphaproteobacteria bacterium]|nr:hypothetical protein [Alphaproteobacteria bacterium]